jgi:hypothetical protein
MSIFPVNFTEDFRTTEPQSFEPVPAGEYILQVTSAELKQTKSGTGLMVNVCFDIIGPEYQGRKIFQNYNIRNDNTVAENIGKQQLKALTVAAGITADLRDTDQLLGATVRASVVIKPAKDGYEASNNIKSYKPTSDAMPCVGFGAPAPSAADAPMGDGIPQGGSFSEAIAAKPAAPAPAAAPAAATNAGWKW